MATARQPQKQRDEQLSARVGVLAALAGIPAALIAGRPLSTLLLLAGSTIGFWFVVRRTIRRRVPTLRTDDQRWATTGLTAIVPLLVVVALLVPTTRNVTAHTIIGWPRTPPVEAGPISTLHGNDGTLRVRLRISNPGTEERVARSVKLTWAALHGISCSHTDSQRYTVSAAFEMRSEPGTPNLGKLTGTMTIDKIDVDSAPAADATNDQFTQPLSGWVETDCADRDLEQVGLTLPLDLTLAPQQSTVFFVDLPRTLRISADTKTLTGEPESTEKTLPQPDTLVADVTLDQGNPLQYCTADDGTKLGQNICRSMRTFE